MYIFLPGIITESGELKFENMFCKQMLFFDYFHFEDKVPFTARFLMHLRQAMRFGF